VFSRADRSRFARQRPYSNSVFPAAHWDIGSPKADPKDLLVIDAVSENGLSHSKPDVSGRLQPETEQSKNNQMPKHGSAMPIHFDGVVVRASRSPCSPVSVSTNAMC
jgi:hypothetical protein